MSLRKQFKTDTAKETQGVFVTLATNTDGSETKFLLARSGGQNKRFSETLKKEAMPLKQQFKSGTVSEAVAERLNKRVFCASVLLGWENVLKADVTNNDADTGYIEYSEANALQLIENLPDLYEELSAFAADINNFKAVEEPVTLKA